MTLVVGITGGIGSGKTTVCQIFESMGIPVYYADPRAKYLMNHDKELKQKVKEILGSEAYHRNGRLNRPYVAQKIFNDKKLRETINQLVHPAVHADAGMFIKENYQAPYVLYEAALLVENGSFRSFDKLIVVTAPETIRVERVVKRDNISKDKVQKRIKAQLPQTEKNKVADYLIDNDGSLALIPQIINIHRVLININE